MKRTLPAGLLVLFLTSLAQAQFTADRMFGYMDRNRDGVIDRSEAERMPGPFREALRAMRIDTSRGIDKATLERAWPRMQEEMRAARDREASGGGYSRDGRSSYYSRGGDSRSSYYSRGGDSRSSYYSRSGSSYGRYDPRSSSSSSRPDPRQQEKSKPKTKRPPKRKPQPRITVDLPTKFSEVDANKDGQIGLYEWDRAKYKEFFEMDKNHDGFLTPRELTTTVAAAPAPRTRSTPRESSTPSRSPAPSSGSTPKPASGSITPEKFDPESSDGRRASYVFRSLDRNKDGSLTEEEWQRSQSTRRDFERLNVKPPLPANLEQFAGLYLAVRKAGGGNRRR